MSAFQRSPSCRILWLSLAVLAAGSPLAGQANSPAYQTGIELTVPTQRSLRQLGESSIQWQRSFVQGDREVADRELDTALGVAERFEMATLPDLSLAVLVRAAEAAEGGDAERARWALEAAERLDPMRPETAFAAAQVARSQGRFLSALGRYLAGYGRLLQFKPERRLWIQNGISWLIFSAMVTAALYLILLIGLRGYVVALDLTELFARILPSPLAWALTALLLLGPLLLPYGPLWFLVLWSILLWGYGSQQERIVLVVVWLVAGAVPLVVEEQQRIQTLEASPAMRAVHSLEEGRLYGRLFTDFGVLKAVLPKSNAVKQLEADLHIRLGQWDLARAIYGELLDDEPENGDVFNNLGVYFFLHGDSGGAIQNFERATVVSPTYAEAFFNLSQAYSNSYHYQNAQRALQEAQRLDQSSVGTWLQEVTVKPVRVREGGMERRQEILRELQAVLEPQDATVSSQLLLVRRGFSLLISIGIALIAIALHFARRGFGYSQPSLRLIGERTNLDRLVRVLVPGIGALRSGRGVAALLAFLPIVALALLPFSRLWGNRLPWGFEPGALLPWLVTLVGIVLVLLIRLLMLRRSENG
jgi:tetratricopeptide (TPR) repeat protein